MDLSAPNIVGAYLADKDKSVLRRLARSQDLWQRRIAILATFYFIKQKNPSVTIELAQMLLQDDQDLIHKAVGWMLREVGKRCSEPALEDFLNKNVLKMPRTMLRYAIEHLPPIKRKEYLLKK